MTKEARRALFETPDEKNRPLYYFTLTAPDDEKRLSDEVARAKALGFATLIPCIGADTVLDTDGLANLKLQYAALLKAAAAKGLTVGLHLSPAFEPLILATHPHLRARILDCKEYVCTAGEQFTRKLHAGDRMSLVAFCEEYGESIDLTPFVSEDKLCWQVPKGNYTVREYLAVEDTERGGINLLSPDTSRAYIEAVFALFSDTFAPYLGTTLSHLCFSEIGFGGRNRRAWDPDFNRAFEGYFGFDPAPYYPILFGNHLGPETANIRAFFMTVRASLLRHGILAALKDFAEQHHLTLFGSLTEPKLTAPSMTVGDAMLANAISPCAVFDKAYMYGTNSVKVAAGAAYNFDTERVDVELFRNYGRHDKDRLYKDAMSAFARGANNTAVHLYDELAQDSSFADFLTRVQTLLRGGSHVADIAMLYPIHDLHSKTCLYISPASGYEYPATPATADYMTLINSISMYSGHDLTLLHPLTVETKCHTEGGVLYMDNIRNREAFRVLVLPASDMISLTALRLFKKFFDEGGKLLATGVLPTRAYERDETGENDREVRRLAEAIFGKDACNPDMMCSFCYNENAAGGEAIFLYFNASAADGTRMTRSSTVNDALNSFGLPFDIYLPDMPRLECTGALNSIYHEFHTIGLHRSFPGGGMLNHIHKRHADCDIYYFSNTTPQEYNHHVLLRGRFDIEEWNPHTGETAVRQSRLFRYRGELYTDLRLVLPSCASTFFIGTSRTAVDDVIEEIEAIHDLQSDHSALTSEF